jgi:hypothetical protein
VQLPPIAKSPAATPPSVAADVSASVPPPVFVTVTLCEALCVPTVWFANASALVDTASAGGDAGTVPVPESATTGTLPLERATASVALRAPVATGEKVNWIVHEAPAPIVVPTTHVPVRPKSPGLGPPIVIPVTE